MHCQAKWLIKYLQSELQCYKCLNCYSCYPEMVHN
uniref:Uncharacterized protein n=1 Tax=Rhizophora mucronata TaxID=61149 RepID=A0A2P2NJA4_RHIMU